MKLRSLGRALRAALLTLLCAFAPASGQEAGVEDCRRIEAALERLSCYDRIESGEAAPPAPRAEQSPREQDAAGAEPEAVRDFGRAPAASVQQDEDGRETLHDSIASTERITPRRHELTLSSGQVWRQVEDKLINLQVGASVTLAPTRWGVNYRLTQEGIAGFIQVRRIR